MENFKQIFKLLPFLILSGLIFPLFVALAQTDGSFVPSKTASPATSAAVATGAPRAVGSQTPLQTTTTPRGVVPTPIPIITAPIPAPTPAPTNSTPTVTPSPVQNTKPREDTSSNPVLLAALAALTILPFGYLIAQSLKSIRQRRTGLRREKIKEDKKDKSRCFNLKKLMDEKLEELRDLRGKLESKGEDLAREKIRDVTKGTTTGETLALIEKAEEEYQRLKKLFEECVVEFGADKQVIIIHGCPAENEKAMDPQTRTYDKHWIPWIKKELTAKGIKVETPLIPNPWRPDYKKFKEELQKYNITKNTILIGHSCGCAFLVRFLGETKKKINKLILVAPWKIPDQGDSVKKTFYEYSVDKEIKSRVREIVMFTSDNEEEDGKKSLKIFHDALGGKIVNLKSKGHYTFGDMGTEKFPDLLEEIMF